MKLQNQLSIKSALRFALPCLAASLLFTACSNEDIETTPEYNDSVNPTVRFSASAPLSSEVASTRIGIDDANKPTVGNHTQSEPVIWIADDEVSVVFVPEGNGNRVYAKFKVDGPTISNDGTSAELVSVDIPTTLSGNYTVYAITPFTTQTANQLNFDLSTQTQLVGHTNYNHLGNSTIMRAAGKPATFTNGATDAVVNFEFEYLTSFLRFNITNDLDESITVTGINLSHPDLIKAARLNYVNGNLNQPSNADLYLQFGAGMVLAPNTAFDSYFSAFPLSASTGNLTLTVYYTDGDGAKEKPFTIPVDDLTGSSPYFPAGSRFLFEISLSSTTSFDYYEFGNFYITKNGAVNSTDKCISPSGTVYTRYYDNKTDYCPDGFNLLTMTWYNDNTSTTSQKRLLFDTIELATGRAWSDGDTTGDSYYHLPSFRTNYPDTYCVLHTSSLTGQYQNYGPNYLDLRCVKRIQ
jgi:hypothetical protein